MQEQQEQVQPEAQQQQQIEEPDEIEIQENEIRKQFPSFPPIFTTYKCTIQQQKDAFNQYKEDRAKAVAALTEGFQAQMNAFCAEILKDYKTLYSGAKTVQQQYGEMLTSASAEIHKFTENYAEQQKKLDPEESNRLSQKLKELEEPNSTLNASNEEYKQQLSALNKKNAELKKKLAENDRIAKETNYKGTNDINRLWQETKNYYKLHKRVISQLNNLKPPTKLDMLRDLRSLKEELAKDFNEANPEEIEETIKQRVEERVQMSLRTQRPLDEDCSRYKEEINCLRMDVAAREDRLNHINSLRTAITSTESFLSSDGSRFFEDRMISAWRNYFRPESECFNFHNGDTILVRARKVLRDLEQDFRNVSI